jgi:hypothetical protein
MVSVLKTSIDRVSENILETYVRLQALEWILIHKKIIDEKELNRIKAEVSASIFGV